MIYSRAKLGDRGVQVALLLQSQAEIGVSFGEIGTQSRRLSERIHRSLDLPLPSKRESERVVRFGEIRLQPQRRTERSGGANGIAFPQKLNALRVRLLGVLLSRASGRALRHGAVTQHGERKNESSRLKQAAGSKNRIENSVSRHFQKLTGLARLERATYRLGSGTKPAPINLKFSNL